MKIRKTKSRLSKGTMPVVTGAALLTLVILLVFSSDALSKWRYNTVQNTTFVSYSHIENGRLNVHMALPDSADLSDASDMKAWISDLDKSPVSLSTSASIDRETKTLRMEIPTAGWNVADRDLYVLWYRYRNKGESVTGGKSLGEVIGSMQVQVILPDSFQVGTRGSFRVLVRDRFSDRPLKGVTVAARIQTDDQQRPLFQATTDALGTFSFDFPVPDDLGDRAELKIDTKSEYETVTSTHALVFKRTERILITTDKPLYQPGQKIHIRALALSQATKKPIVSTGAVIEVIDGKGNKVFKEQTKTDNFGIVSAEFQLAHELNMGTYRISAMVGDRVAEKTVEVKRYVLPKFKVSIEIGKPYYKPGEVVKGKVNAQYIFGKPVNGGQVTLTGYASQVGAEQFAQIRGKTNAEGLYEFEMTLPDYLVGQDLTKGKARVQLAAEVTDTADHKQQALKSVQVASAPFSLVVVPESGTLVKGLSNRLFFMVSHPDGSPAKVRIKDPWKKDTTHQTDELGLVILETPKVENALVMDLEVDDELGNQVKMKQVLRADWKSNILLRTDKPIYRVGENMELTAFAVKPASKSVYVDMIVDNQTVLTKAMNLEQGRASLSLTTTPEMTGSLVVNAYIIDPGGNMTRDTRLVYVNAANDLQIGIKPTKEIFRPGEKARIDFSVTDQSGHPVAAALGVTIVDEAVFALQDMQPGFEKVFFLLEKELMKPRFEFHSYTPEKLVQERTFDKAMMTGYEVMLSSIEPIVVQNIPEVAKAKTPDRIQREYQKKIEADLRRLQRLAKEKVKQGFKGEEAVKAIAKEGWLDPWGTPYDYRYDKSDIYWLHSAGPDHTLNTDDDLMAVDEEVEKKYYRQVRGAGGIAFGKAMPMAAGRARNDVFDGAELAEEEGDIMTKTVMSGNRRSKDKNGGGVRIRKFFPETLYNNPALITDGSGHASISLDIADSITTWRIGSMANSADGKLGSGTAPVRVFQDFFVDIDFPVALTRNDEVEVPIALYNYLKRRQTIKIEIEKADWFELLEGDYSRKIKMESGQVTSISLKVRAKKVGNHKLTVVAKGTKMSDAISRGVDVEPDGIKFETVFSDKLEGNVEHGIRLPEGAIEGSEKLFVKIYPGLMSQVIEGLDSILRMPSGCFEQTSSATYPNIMVLDYMKTTGKITPEIRMKAEGFINQGYQRLLSFEVPGGGFEWFGNTPAHKILTAYGLMEFYDMSAVHNVDPNVISRTQNWLVSQQKSDGSWEPNKRFLDAVASKFATDVLRNTAFISWALAKSEYKGAPLTKAQSYLADTWKKTDDPYTLALILNAFAYNDANAEAYDSVLEKLMDMRKEVDGQVFWEQKDSTAVRSMGKSAEIETTALVGQALLIKGRSTNVVNGIIAYLAKNKDSFGNWHSTQATVYALKVLILSAKGAGNEVNGEATVRVNGAMGGAFVLTTENADVMKLLDLSGHLHAGDNNIRIQFSGTGASMYQVIGRYFMPGELKKEKQPITIDVDYDKTTLKSDDMVTCKVRIENHRKGDFGMVVVDLGIPPGFDVLTGDLKELVGSKKIQKFETTARQVIVYLDEVKKGQPVAFEYRIQAKYPVKAMAPGARVYEYYNPDVADQSLAVKMNVNK